MSQRHTRATEVSSCQQKEGGGGVQRGNLLVPKLLAFFTAFSGVGWNRFGVFLLLDAGFTPSQVGFMKTLGFFVKLVAQPLWGVLADSCSLFGSLLVSFGFSVLSLEIVRQALIRQWPFAIFCGIRIARAGCNSISPLVDAIILEEVEYSESGLPQGERQGYGRQKMFASLAWGVGAFFFGWFVDHFGLANIFVLTYFLCGLCMILTAAIYHKRHKREGKKTAHAELECGEKTPSTAGTKKLTSRQTPWQIFRSIYQLLRMKGILTIAFQIFLFGFTMVLADSIMYLQIEREFKLTRRFNGLTTLISVLSAMPSYYFSESLLNARGAAFMFRCAQVLTCFRFFLMSLITAETANWIIPLQLLHGVCFSMNWSAGTDVFQAASPPGITSSAQVIVTMLYFTLGKYTFISP